MNKIKIGNICEILNGFAFKSENYTDSGIRIIRIANVQKGYIDDTAPAFYPQDTKELLNKYMLEEGDLLLSLTGNVGRVAIIGKELLPAALNQRVACLRMKTDIILKDYLFHFLNSDYFENKCIQSSKGVAQKNLSTEWLKNYEIPLYSKSEQKEIIAILNLISSIIVKRKQEIQCFDNLIKARFVEMFGNPILNDKSWITSSIEDVCIEIYGGGTPSKQHPEYYENGSIPWVTSKDMKCDVICDSQIHINEKGLENSTARMVPTNSVIMVIRSGILKHTLPVAVNTAPITVNQDLKVFIPDSQKIMSRFFALQLKMHERDILSGVRAVTADNIEFNELKKRKIIVPPLVSQQLFTNFLIQIDKSKFDNIFY